MAKRKEKKERLGCNLTGLPEELAYGQGHGDLELVGNHAAAEEGEGGEDPGLVAVVAVGHEGRGLVVVGRVLGVPGGLGGEHWEEEEEEVVKVEVVEAGGG